MEKLLGVSWKIPSTFSFYSESIINLIFKLLRNHNIKKTPLCNIKKKLPLVKVFTNCVLNVKDECTMVRKSGVKASDQTFCDIWSFAKMTGEIVLIFTGHFRQALRVVSRGTQSGQINVSLKSYTIWSKVDIFTFTTKMYLFCSNARYTRKGIS